MKRSKFGEVKVAAYAAVTVIATITTIYGLGYRYNYTESMPVGVYKKVDETIKLGSVVQFCPPVKMKYEFMPAGFCAHHEAQYIKQVIAVPGDVVEVSKEGVYVNGSYIKKSTLSKREDLPKAYGVHQLKAGEYWTFGSGKPESSFDSRYYGIVKKETITVLKKV